MTVGLFLFAFIYYLILALHNCPFPLLSISSLKMIRNARAPADNLKTYLGRSNSLLCVGHGAPECPPRQAATVHVVMMAHVTGAANETGLEFTHTMRP
jgi:hypothetical protein